MIALSKPPQGGERFVLPCTRMGWHRHPDGRHVNSVGWNSGTCHSCRVERELRNLQEAWIREDPAGRAWWAWRTGTVTA